MRRVLMVVLVGLVASAELFSRTPDSVKVEGGLLAGQDVSGVQVYKGIPFAAPPIGDLRWKDPQPVVAWTGVKQAASFASPCMQQSSAGGQFSEDCLHLNVWTAANPGEKRPVMVYYHGGGLYSGSTAGFDGTALARKGVVVVTTAYRLGAMGYLAHPELTAESSHHSSGNYGTLDQIAALKWVQKNIRAFGGDPGNVTIFGQSGGSWSVSVLVATPLTKGLFTKAIGQSGARFYRDIATNAWNAYNIHVTESRDGIPSGEQAGVAFAKTLGVDSVKALRALPAEKIMSIPNSGVPRLIDPPEAKEKLFFPVEKIDGWVLPTDVYSIYAQHKQNRVSVIVGANDNEENSVVQETNVPKTMAEYRQWVERRYGDMVKEFDALYPVNSTGDILRAIRDTAGDHDFVLEMRTWARMMTAAGSKAYLYQFSHLPPNPRGLGASHGAELSYVFNTLSNPWPYTDIDRRVADVISSYWTNFATTGNPNGTGLPQWAPYDSKNEPYLELGDSPELRNHLKKARVDFQERWSERRRQPSGRTQ